MKTALVSKLFLTRYFDEQAYSDDEEDIDEEVSDDAEITRQEQAAYFSEMENRRGSSQDYWRRLHSRDATSLAQEYEQTTVLFVDF